MIRGKTESLSKWSPYRCIGQVDLVSFAVKKQNESALADRHLSHAPVDPKACRLQIPPSELEIFKLSAKSSRG